MAASANGNDHCLALYTMRFRDRWTSRKSLFNGSQIPNMSWFDASAYLRCRDHICSSVPMSRSKEDSIRILMIRVTEWWYIFRSKVIHTAHLAMNSTMRLEMMAFRRNQEYCGLTRTHTNRHALCTLKTCTADSVYVTHCQFSRISTDSGCHWELLTGRSDPAQRSKHRKCGP